MSITDKEIEELVEQATLITKIAAKSIEKVAPDVAHSYMVLYKALLEEGFLDEQATLIVAQSVKK